MKLIIMKSTVSGASAATTPKNFIDFRKWTHYLDNDELLLCFLHKTTFTINKI